MRRTACVADGRRATNRSADEEIYFNARAHIDPSAFPDRNFHFDRFLIPAILDEGTFTLAIRIDEEIDDRNSFDLDRSVNTGGKEADISLSESCGSMCFVYLDTMNGAEGYGIGDPPVVVETCISNRAGFERNGINNWGVHNFFYILTSQGNLSLVTVADISDISHDEKLRLIYITWAMASSA